MLINNPLFWNIAQSLFQEQIIESDHDRILGATWATTVGPRWLAAVDRDSMLFVNTGHVLGIKLLLLFCLL